MLRHCCSLRQEFQTPGWTKLHCRIKSGGGQMLSTKASITATQLRSYLLVQGSEAPHCCNDLRLLQGTHGSIQQQEFQQLQQELMSLVVLRCQTEEPHFLVSEAVNSRPIIQV